MAVASMKNVTDYATANKFLNGKESRVLANNTTLDRLDADTIAVTYHYTAIATFHREPVAKYVNGAVQPIVAEYSNGGHASVTTSGRISQLLPSRNYLVNIRQYEMRLTHAEELAGPENGYKGIYREVGSFRDLALTADGTVHITR